MLPCVERIMATGATSAADRLGQMSTFVVTGGAGFIGSNIVEARLRRARPDNVVVAGALDRIVSYEGSRDYVNWTDH